MTPQEVMFLAWAFKGLLLSLAGVVSWVFLREIKRLDRRVTEEADALLDRIKTEVKYRDQHNAGVDVEINSLRVRQHELGNVVAGQAGAVDSVMVTVARMESLISRLDQTVNDLRVLIAETRGQSSDHPPRR